MNQERRVSRREMVPSLVYLDLQPNNGGILLNLNASGMQVSVARPLATAKSVRFSFGLDSSTRIEGTGRIAWIAESGKTAGICFVDLPESSLGQIAQWLKSGCSTGIVQEPDELACATTQAAEAETEPGCPWPTPCIPEIPQSVEPEKAAVFQTTIEKEERPWDLPAEEETAPAVAEEQSPSALDSWQPGFEWIGETTRVEPEIVTTASGLNDRLPVYTMPVSVPAPDSTPHLASQVIFDELRQFGWGLERDWHVGLGTLLLAAGFLPLWNHPPLVMLAAALWIVSALLLTNRKQPPKDSEEPIKGPHNDSPSGAIKKEGGAASATSATDPATAEIGSPSETGGGWAANRTPVGEER